MKKKKWMFSSGLNSKPSKKIENTTDLRVVVVSRFPFLKNKLKLGLMEILNDVSFSQSTMMA